MSYRYRECRVCRGAMDPGEGCGGVCDGCIREGAEEIKRRDALKNLLDPSMQIRFKQMGMEEFLNA